MKPNMLEVRNLIATPAFTVTMLRIRAPIYCAWSTCLDAHTQKLSLVLFLRMEWAPSFKHPVPRLGGLILIGVLKKEKALTFHIHLYRKGRAEQ